MNSITGITEKSSFSENIGSSHWTTYLMSVQNTLCYFDDIIAYNFKYSLFHAHGDVTIDSTLITHSNFKIMTKLKYECFLLLIDNKLFENENFMKHIRFSDTDELLYDNIFNHSL